MSSASGSKLRSVVFDNMPVDGTAVCGSIFDASMSSRMHTISFDCETPTKCEVGCTLPLGTKKALTLEVCLVSSLGINPDHLSYFRFVGRIVGKAVADGFLLDAHFTRSLYKHMLGMEPTHHDMEAIDPDYYRNLKTILEYNLEEIGLDLTFSIEDHSFGRSQVIDLITNGRNVAVTEERKEEYVRLVCQHRMSTAISSQIRSFLDGFGEMVSPELISIFNPRELELLISGLPGRFSHLSLS